MPKPLKPVRQRDLIRRLAELLISSGVTVKEALLSFHRALLEAALAETAGDQKAAAERQQMPRTTLREQCMAVGLLPRPQTSADDGQVRLPQARAAFPQECGAPAPAPFEDEAVLPFKGIALETGDE
jgi:hypothetical protein